MILATERVGTSFLSWIASATISSKLSGSFCERRISRFIGRRPEKPFLRHAASSRYRVLSEISLFSAICERIWLLLAGSRSSARSGEIIAKRSDAFSSCQVVTSLFFMGCIASLLWYRESITHMFFDIEPKSVHSAPGQDQQQDSSEPPAL